MLSYQTKGNFFVQTGIVQGSDGCGDANFPTIFSRIQDPEVFSFINKVPKLFQDTILIIGGYVHDGMGFLKDIELINPRNSQSTCQAWPDLDEGFVGATGGLIDGLLVVCNFVV